MKQILVFALLIATGVRLGLAQDPTASSAQRDTSSQENRDEHPASSANLTAIRAGSQAFVAAFNQHDAKTLAALWSENGEYIDNEGITVAGRDAIEKDYIDYFAENPDVEIQIAIDSLRLLSDEVAIEDGRAIVQPPPAGVPGVSKYTAVHTKVNGKWLMASVRDTWIEAQATRQSVADLGWLIGSWVAEEHGIKNESVCSWVANEQFVERKYVTTQVDGTKSTGVQLIGWNPLDDRMQSWSFSPDGGHDVGLWLPMQNGWMAEIRGVNGEGTRTTAVNLLTRLDENAYVWQSVERSVGGNSLPDTDEVVIKRQAAETARQPPVK